MCYMRCGHCTMVYANPVPKTFVTGQFYQDRTQDFYLCNQTHCRLRPGSISTRMAAISFMGLTGRVLDVGCSTGVSQGIDPLGV